MLSRLSPRARSQHARFFIRVCYTMHPKSRAVIRKVVTAALRGRVNVQYILVCIRTSIGDVETRRVSGKVAEHMETKLWRERTMECADCDPCCGCLSYESQLKCVSCGRMRFCIGCSDYNEGVCLSCAEERKA